MLKTIVRKEHKNLWEKRTPLTPTAIQSIIESGLKVDIEKSEVRIFDDLCYSQIPCELFDSPNAHQLVLGIKEPPIESIQSKQVHICFSHTMKGQDYNMPLLQKFIDQKATLLDYELIVDKNNQRTIAFGRHAGIAGAIDTLYVLGKKYRLSNLESPLESIQQTIKYKTIEAAKKELNKINVLNSLPLRILIIGTGNVGKGAEEVCQWLNLPQISSKALLANEAPKSSWYCVLSSKHLNVKITDTANGSEYDRDDFYKNGSKHYKSIFESLLGRFDVVLQTSYWTETYPQHMSKKQFFQHQDNLPEIIGDISCDINGSFACTHKISSIDQPAYSYDANTDSIIDELNPEHLTVMAIDNLPCELSLDASEHFSSKLVDYTPHLMKMNLENTFNELVLIDELKKSLIVYSGELTPNFKYLEQYL